MKHFLLFTMMFLSMGLMAQTNLFPAGDFENGIDGWTSKFLSGTAGTVTATDDAATGTGAILIDVTTPHDLLTKVQLISSNIDGAETKHNYIMSANLKSDVAENEFKMQFCPVGDAGTQYISAPKDENGEWLHLTSEYKNYSWLVGNIKEGYGSSAFMRFQCSKHVAKYYMDDLKIFKVDGIYDKGFEETDTDLGWDLNQKPESGAAANYSIETSAVHSGSGALKVEVTSADTVDHIHAISRARFFVEKGDDYEFSFWAKGSPGDVIHGKAVRFNGVNTNSGNDSLMFTLTGEYQKYIVPITDLPDSIFSLKVRWDLGQQKSTIYIDDVNVERVIPANVSELKKEEFSIFPNPVNEQLLVKNGQNKVFQIIDLSGKIRKEFRPETMEISIDVSDLNPGFYIIRNNENEIRKFVKN